MEKLLGNIKQWEASKSDGESQISVDGELENPGWDWKQRMVSHGTGTVQKCSNRESGPGWGLGVNGFSSLGF